MIITLLIICSGILNFSDQTSAESQERVHLKTLTSSDFLFSLDYPAKYDLRNYGKESFVLIENNEFWVEFDIFDIARWMRLLSDSRHAKTTSGDWFKEIIIDRAIAHSAADGPDGSYHCSDPEITHDAITKNGLRVLKFYLTGTLSNFTEKTEASKRVGPFYGVSILVNEMPYAILMQYKRQELATPEHENMLYNIIHSIKSIPITKKKEENDE